MIDLGVTNSRNVSFRTSTLNQELRTVEVVWSTGAAVKRYDWSEGYFLEELSLDPKHVRLDRLNAGASFLDTHEQYSMRSRLGAVVPGTARIEKGLGIATVQITRNPEGERLMVDLRDGMPLSISVGYKTHAYEREEGEDEGKLPTLRAIDWEPMELSAVPVPADPGAQSRGNADMAHLNPTTAQRATGAAGEEQLMTTTAEVQNRAEVDAEILRIGERFDASARLVRRAIAGKKSVEDFRSMILDEQRAEQAKTETFSIAPDHYARSDFDLSEGLADAIMARADRSHTPAQANRSLVGLSVPEMARRALEAKGTGTTGWSPNELVKRGLNSTSDFPTALGMAGQRQLSKAYAAAPSGLKAIAKSTTSRDFRPKATVILAGGGQLLRVNEHGEYKRATFVEGVESYTLSSFGRIFGITRQALVNDDLGVFADLPARFGRAAIEFEATYLATMLEANGKMSDAKAVFHADHANLAAVGSALSVASLSAGRLAMRQQVDANGELVTIVPKYLIVPSALETIAEQLLATIAPTTTADTNPFAGKLELIVEPRLKSTTAWYLAADPTLFPSIECAHLEGEEGPRLDQRVGFDVDGMEFKVALDFGAAILDHRGLYKNPGA